MPELPYKNIDEYIATCAPEIQPILAEIRATIHAAAPELTEKISWAMPTFARKKNIVHFFAHKKHIGLYPGPEAIEHFAERVAAYHTSKGAIQFPLNKPMPLNLIADIVRYNLTIVP